MDDATRGPSAVSTVRSLGPPLLWTAYLLVPVAGWGLFPGRPLGVLGAAALALVWWLFATDARLPSAAIAVVCVLGKVLLGGALSAERGFVAYYYANPSWAPPHERSVDHLTAAATRLDPKLRFRDDGRPELPLFFFNDTTRFNFYEPGQPRREGLPFSVIWTGHLHVPRLARRVVYVQGPGVAASIRVDGAERAAIRPDEPWKTATVELPAGWRGLEIRLSVPSGGPRRFEAGVVEPGGRGRAPFGADTVLPWPLPSWRRWADAGVRGLGLVADVLLAVVLTSSAALATGRAIHGLRRAPPGGRPERSRHALALGWLAGLLDAFRFAAPMAGRAVVLEGGNDWLTYESYARDIALHGPTMSLDAPLGQGAPFYYQPLYPYFLALVHLVFGEDLFGAVLVQRFLLAVTVWAVWRLTALLFDRVAGVAALLLGAGVLYGYGSPIAALLLTEALYVPLTVLWALGIARLLAGAVAGREVALTGILGGLATLTRTTLLLAWAGLVAPLVGTLVRQHRSRALWLLVVPLLACLGLAGVRNWVVSGRFVILPTSGPINLYLGNPPPADLDLSGSGRRAMYERLGLDPRTRSVLEYAATAPGAFGRHLARKAAFALGCFGALGAPAGCSVTYLAIWIATLAGLMTLAGRRLPAGAHGPPRAVPALIGLSHLGAVVLFAPVIYMVPNVYGDRLVFPLAAFLLPYAAAGLGRAAEAAAGRVFPLRSPTGRSC